MPPVSSFRRRQKGRDKEPLSYLIPEILKLVFKALMGFFAESMTAVGSNPQWSMQCVQRGSLPAPYLDQSVFLIRS